MSRPPLPRKLPANPDLRQLKRQSRELLLAYKDRKTAAVAEVTAYYSGAEPGAFALHHAQLILARAYGFESWPKLKAYVDGVNIQQLADCVKQGDLPRVRALLKLRPELADMQMTYGDEHRPLHFAVYRRDPGMVRLLMQHGASARRGIHPHRAATTAFTLAFERGFDEIVTIMKEEEGRRAPAVAAPNPRRDFQQALMQGDESVLRSLLLPNLGPADPIRFQAAVALGDLEWLRARHAESPIANSIDWRNGGLLTIAVRYNRPEILSFLLEIGFDPQELIREGEGSQAAVSQGYPLWHCGALGRREMAEILLAHGASLHEHVDSSGSPVHSAFSHRQWEMVEFFRDRGAPVTADTAAIYRRVDIARHLLAADPANALELLEFGASGGSPEIVAMALEFVDFPRDDPRWFRYLTRCMDFWNHIPWLHAANQEFDRSTYLPCLRLVLARCSPNLIGGFGRTPLHEAAAMGDFVTGDESASFVRALLAAGAKTDARDDILRSTPLGWACRWNRPQVVQLLLEHGADPGESEAEPWARPLAWARKGGRLEIVRILRDAGARDPEGSHSSGR